MSKRRALVSAHRIVVVGGSFAGLTAAYDLKRDLGDAAEVTVIARDERFVFIPSLIWVIAGWRKPGQISFDLAPSLERKGIRFMLATVERFDPAANKVLTDRGEVEYDHLVIATGPKFDFEAVPGLGPSAGTTLSICSMSHSIDAAKAFLDFTQDPGPVVLGATQGASCFGAEYEMVFNIDRALRQAKIRKQSPVTFLTAEPYLGHFGIGGMGHGEPMVKAFFKMRRIDSRVNVAFDRVEPGVIHLTDGEEIPYKYAIVIPPFKGVDAVTNTPGLGNERGFIPTDDGYRHVDFENVYAAGVAVAVAPPEPTPIPTGVPKTGWMSEVMARVAAHNIVADIKGGERKELPFGEISALCIMDAGTQGVILVGDHVFRPRKREWLIPGPWSHWAKLAFEKYYMGKMRYGASRLP
jgi:sulfide:quinone oxidoreductase